MTDTPKPPLPARTFDDWPRIPVDTDRGSPFYRVDNLAERAANFWVTGPDGPYKQPGMTLHEIVSGAIHEGLLHLVELGLVDIDVERLNAASGWPARRIDCRPETPAPEHRGAGANAEDCPACAGTNPPYPFLCPGPPKDTTHG
ncbi:hypothetical protein ACUXZZ_45235 (plasmid) [Streptomyces graminifolii]|uniref:hypothetical protein n=1 Tax=Streptomyces graminifolii TaxID=1266771 RepID=UPI004059C771